MKANQRSQSRCGTTSLFLIILTSLLIVFIVSMTVRIKNGAKHEQNSKKIDNENLSKQSSISYRESFGFYNDDNQHNSSNWKRRKSLAKKRKQWISSSQAIRTFYQINFNPQWKCGAEQVYVTTKWVCDPHRLVVPRSKSSSSPCIMLSIYSTVGPPKDNDMNDSSSSSIRIENHPNSNPNYLFEYEFQQDVPQCQIYIVDPSFKNNTTTTTTDSFSTSRPGFRATFLPIQIISHAMWQKHQQSQESNMVVHPIVVVNGTTTKSRDGETHSGELHSQMTLRQIIQYIQHQNDNMMLRRPFPLDILHLDLNGLEWDLVSNDIVMQANDDAQKENDNPNHNMWARQLLVSLHFQHLETPRFFRRLTQEAGYVITHKTPNLLFGGGREVDFTFLALNLKK